MSAYDQVAGKLALKEFETTLGRGFSRFELAASALAAVDGADALIVVTEWNEFRQIDLTEVRSRMAAPRIFDARNVYDPVQLKKLGFESRSVGRV